MDSIAQCDAFFSGRPQEWALFEALREALLARYPSTQLRAMKTCIAFDDPKPYVYVSYPPRKSMGGILMTVSLRERMESARFFMVVPISKNRYTVHLHLTDRAQIDEELMRYAALSHR